MRGDVPEESAPASDLRQVRTMRGRRPGDRYVRVVEPFAESFKRRAPGHLVASERVLEPRGAFGHATDLLRRVVVGRRIATEREMQERVGPVKGLAVFASDNISSSAYATEEIMRVLVLAGVGALALTMPLTIAIVVVLAIVVISYQQTIRAYPNGGGSYIVASDNLGRGAGPGRRRRSAHRLRADRRGIDRRRRRGADLDLPGPVRPSACCSASAFVGHAVARQPARHPRERAPSSPSPTYIYLLAIYGLLAYRLLAGRYRHAAGVHAAAGWRAAHGVEALGLLLILRAFASGSVALTGTEAVSNGVPAFKPPEARNAGIVLILMGVFFAIDLPGDQLPGRPARHRPRPDRAGDGDQPAHRAPWSAPGRPFHYLIQVSTALLLVLAANTAFADFPRLASILARTASCRASSSSAATAWRSAWDHGAGRAGGGADRRLRRQRHQPDPAVHGRRLRCLHAEPVGDGAPLVAAPRTRSGAGAGGRRLNGAGARRHRRRRDRSSASPSSRSAPGWCCSSSRC